MRDRLLAPVVEVSTIVELLRMRVLHQPDQPAYTFLVDGELEQVSMTYADVDRRARAIAALLQQVSAPGERALLIYPPGLDYVTAFFGCLYAGVIAVPAYPPQPRRPLTRLHTIIGDAQVTVGLTTTRFMEQLQEQAGALPATLANLHWLATDSLTDELAADWQPPSIASQTVAFLQYTSGSTAAPRGVMVSHGNLLHNQRVIQHAFGHADQEVIVGWLPLYHDMGLIGNVLQPLYIASQCMLMSPMAFLQKPLRWLEAISRYRATTSGGPNFAYDLCARKVSPEQRAQLDLRSWRVAFNGAEPVRYDTLERFAVAFADCGFRREAFYPCYGLAEATLFVTGGIPLAPPAVRVVDREALSHNDVIQTQAIDGEAQMLVSSGPVRLDQQLVIVDPETLQACPADRVGEVWVAGSSVAQGYWNQPDATSKTFNAYLAKTGAGPFLRTGDLGFVHDEELFVTGRIKDLIIIRGRNHYPQDIELTVERSHPALRLGCSAAFAVEVAGAEQLVVVQELERRYQNQDCDHLLSTIRQAVAEQHDLHLHALVLIKTGTIPKTSSGKIQRHACKAAFLAQTLMVVASSTQDGSPPELKDELLNRAVLLTFDPPQRHEWLLHYLQNQVGRVLHLDPTRLNPHQPLIMLGLDSLMAVELQHSIEAHLNLAISAESFLRGDSIEQIALHIAEQLAATEQAPVPLRAQPYDQDLPLSFAQQRMWFLQQLEPDNPFYNIHAALRLCGPLDRAALQHSIDMIVGRHETLRTSFTMLANQPVQVIAAEQAAPLRSIDLRALPAAVREAEVMRLALAEARHPFDLATSPLLRTTLLCLDQTTHVLLLTMHHIISDGWSMRVMTRELAILYNARVSGVSATLPKLPVQYADVARWQQSWLRGSVQETQLVYWKRQLGGTLTPLRLPTDRPRPAAQSFQGAQQTLVLPKDVTDALKALSRQEGVTLFMLVLAAFKTLLMRSSGQTDIIVGSPTTGRTRAELEGLIGFFVNTLVLRTDLSGNPRFRDLLQRVRGNVLDAFTNQEVPFEKLVEVLQPKRSLGQAPLFQVLFVFQNVSWNELHLNDLTSSPLVIDNQTAKFDLAFYVTDLPDGLTGELVYSTDLFDASTIARLLSQFSVLLRSIIAQPDTLLSSLEVRTDVEKEQRTMEQKQREQSSYQQFKRVQPKAVTLSSSALIETSDVQPGQSLPLVVRPAVESLDLTTWATSNMPFIEETLRTRGGMLLRDFNISTVPAFERFTNAMSSQLLDYVERSTPRHNVSDKVYTSTEYPAEHVIPMHNEMSYSRMWPMKIWFCSIKAAERGGETPIADSRRVFALIDPAIREQFIQKQVLYVRNYGAELDLSWEDVFQTNDRTAVESYCRANSIAFEWLAGNRLRTRQVCQAVAAHPVTGEMVWFNQAHLFHPSSLHPAVQQMLRETFAEEDLPRSAYYGDGSPIELEAFAAIRAAYDQATISFPWKEGDVLMLDNMLVAHGRAPFVGARKVVVAMAEPMTSVLSNGHHRYATTK